MVNTITPYSTVIQEYLTKCFTCWITYGVFPIRQAILFSDVIFTILFLILPINVFVFISYYCADVIEPSSNSTFSGQKQNSEVPENATALPGSNLVSQVNVSSTAEESAGEVMREGLMKDVGQETDANGSGKIDSDENVVPFLDSEYPDQTSKAESKCQEIEKKSTDPMPAAEVVLSKEEHGVETTSKICLGDPVPGNESAKLSDAADATQRKLGAERGLDFTSSVDSNESFS